MIIIERLFLVFLLLFHHRILAIEFDFDLQPQPIRLNDLEEIYLTNDDHFLGQVLYRFDRIHLACECRSSTSYRIFWTINNRRISDRLNSSDLEFEINEETVETPTTDVVCYCLFSMKNQSEIEKSFRYQFYIDLESEPTLKPIVYVLKMNFVKHNFLRLIHQPQFKIVFPLFLFIFLASFSLIVVNLICSS